ncbi:MAG: hypothetical protein FWD31_10085 [Planctomycetaceae bacterium]|nr:hypothetical protein [Planctomycetaceae bacterium]
MTGLVGVLSFAATLLAPIGAVFASVFTVMAGGTMIMASLASLVTTGVVGSVVTLGATLSGIIGLIGTAVPILVTCSSGVVALIGSIASFTAGLIASLSVAKAILVCVAALLPILTVLPKAFSGVIDSVKSLWKFITDIPSRFIRIAQTARTAFGQVIKDAKAVGSRLLVVFQDLTQNAFALFESLKNTIGGLWDALSIGDFSTMIEIVWADFELRFAQGKQFLQNFCTEAKAIFSRFAESIKFNFLNVFDEIKKQALEVALHVAKWTPGSSIFSSEIIIKESIKSIEFDGKRRARSYKDTMEAIQGADWTATNQEILLADSKKQSVVHQAAFRRYYATLQEAEKIRASQIAAELPQNFETEPQNRLSKWWYSPDPLAAIQPTESRKTDFWNSPDPLQAIIDGILPPRQALHPALLAVGAFTGSQGTFSGLEARAGGFKSIDGKVDEIIDLLDQIATNTEDDEEWT